VKITVGDLAAMWHSAAYSIRGGDQAPAADYVPDAVSLAKADQLDACAADLLNTSFRHDLVKDAATGRWWKKLR
jgi:hypothetical protein